ncbi:SWIM zinc finger family protein [Mesorhizobium sp. VK9D]|uniref:SWIM zinc finger family protein n=1 Tax=Mesorhizobium australafricanum TaxID=3072311 RepID=UPI002A242714|nr:SWIM zinc finger family protein [Mesorhizobium sp. VK9D]MDX8456463.1 SWIM zinc finger family protein [Mesorhizobium sp. VK9D]
MEESVPGRMNSSLRRFDVVALRKLAGEKVFARGEAYHLNGHVEILSIDNWRVLAQVAGSEEYRTEVTGRDFEIAGSCSCPAFGDTGFCKHMVAVALAGNVEAAGTGAEAIGVLDRIRQYLRSKGPDTLVEMIVEQIDRDPVLFPAKRSRPMRYALINSSETAQRPHISGPCHSWPEWPGCARRRNRRPISPTSSSTSGANAT